MLSMSVHAKDSLPPVVDGKVPQSVDELWAGYDPRAEALDVKVIHEWDETYQGKPMKVQMLTFTVGTFKGKVSRISAYYAYPTDAKGKVPGLVQVHGGGQRADKNTVKVDAANGYACLSLNWGGRELEDQKPGEPGTDWGAIDPTQKHVPHYFRLTPDDKTAETVYSPRNNNWFILTLATRRGLTFLEQQAVVDSDRLGVYGHSMGGTITGQVAGLDPRIKAAVPSCGGAGITQEKNFARPGASADRRVGDKLYSKTIDATASLGKLKRPILGQSPQNDFNCIYDDLQLNWRVIPDPSLVHFSTSPHLNHRHVAESEFARIRFFDAFLKGEGAFPATPELTVQLKASNGIPVATVKPDAVDQVQRVQIYYSINPHSLTRFWRRAETARTGDVWKAHLPVMSTAMPLFVMANVEYTQPRPLIGAPPTFLVSTWEQVVDPPALKAAGVKETDRPERMIQASFDDWGDWYRIGWPNTQHALSGTRKLTDPKWRGPDGASLTIDVKDPQGGNFLMVFDVNNWGAYAGLQKSVYYCVKPLAKTDDWQTVNITLTDLKSKSADIPALPASWQGITDLAIVAGLHRLPGSPESILSGGTWPGARELRNLRWTGGAYAAPLLYPGGKLSVEEFQKIFQDDIDKSIQLEKKDAQQSKGEGE
jgi:pimeloyl-ACP methyl ester carboxylesterase